MNDEQLEAIFIEALTALDAGATADQVLARYPDQAEELRPILRAAIRLAEYGNETRNATPAANAPARAAFLSRAAAIKQVSPVARLTRLAHRRVLLSFLTMLILVIAISGSVLGASAASLPGEPLYGVKRSVENIQLSLAFNTEQRVNLEETYSRRRLGEVKAVQASKRKVQVEFTAPVEALGDSVWTIGGFTVQVMPDTIVSGTVRAGDLVKVIGQTLPAGQIAAERIEAEGVDIAGVVEAITTSTWTIGDERVLVNKDTRINGAARLGVEAVVHARRFPDGSLLALTIEVNDHNLPIPAATPTPGSGPTATLLNITEPTADTEPRQRDIVEPSQTPEPAHEPHPTKTLQTPEPPEPLQTPEATRPERPGRTPKPTEPPESTGTPERNGHPEPTHDPHWKQTLEPTDTH